MLLAARSGFRRLAAQPTANQRRSARPPPRQDPPRPARPRAASWARPLPARQRWTHQGNTQSTK
eukprot:11719348-Heterocapsa_arctica.AAC.1